LSFWLESQRDDGALVTHNGYDHGHHAVGAMIVPWVFAEHYRLTGDKEWLQQAAPKLKAGADYIVKRRKTTIKDTGAPADMARIEAGARPFPGLQPAIACGDGGGRLFVFADTTGYEIVSDVDHGKINATVELPARKAPQELVLRLRHPTSAPIQGVTVNGKPWTGFDRDKETITLKGLTGTVAVTAKY
jgi:hypothetical protein